MSEVSSQYAPGDVSLPLRVFGDAAAASRAGAEFIADEARQAVAERGRFVMAASGGTTPYEMYRQLAAQDLPWPKLHVVQVDERMVPPGNKDRSLRLLEETLVELGELAPRCLHPMPADSPYPEPAMRFYSTVLSDLAGTPPVLDVVHLGLGADGHTGSLVPGDAALDVKDRDVVSTAGPYRGTRRMTLTYPILNRARAILWLVTGGAKAEMLGRLLEGDARIPAGRIHRERAVVFADEAAGGRFRHGL